jgi:hypothetical protein
LSTVATCETFTTDDLGRPLARRLRGTFPGAMARSVLEVIAAAMTVAILLALKGSD